MSIGFLKLMAVVALIVILLGKKVHLFYSMILAAVILGYLFGMDTISIWQVISKVPISSDVIRVIGVIILVLTLNGLMKSYGTFDSMLGLLRGMFRDLRTVLVLPPVIVGLLPMPAGTLFTASMTDLTGDELKITQEFKTYINFWFRHIWEFSLPIYPAIILESSIVGASVVSITRYQFAGSLFAIAGGILFGFLLMPRHPIGGKLSYRSVNRLLVVLWPIVAVIVGVLVFGVNILFMVIFVIVAFVLVKHVSLGDLWAAFRGLNWRIVLDLFGVFVFKSILISSGAFKVVPEFIYSTGISSILVLFLIPFFIAFLTGSTPATVGVTFPTLLGMFSVNGTLDIGLVSWAFTGAYVGVMISPFHLCLSLSREYFKADWAGVYKLLLLPLLCVSVCGIVFFVWIL